MNVAGNAGTGPGDGEACARWISLVDRDALGEPLSADDRRFVREHLESCRACAAEARAWTDLSEMHGAEAEPVPKRDIDRLLGSLQKETRRSVRPLAEARRSDRPPPAGRRSERPPALRGSVRPPSDSRATLPGPLGSRGVAAAALAAAIGVAAAVFLWPRDRREVRPSTPAAPPVQGDAKVHVHLVSGAGRVDGQPAELGAELVSGARLEAGDGPLCVRIEPEVTACLSRASRGEVADTKLANRRLKLQEGKIVVSLGAQPEHTSFAVETEWGTVTAVGTEFAVAIDVSPMNPHIDQAATVRVGHGSVVVRAPQRPEVAVTAGESLWLGETRVQRDVATTERLEDRAVIAPALMEVKGGGTLRIRTPAREAKVTVNGKPVGASPVALVVPAGTCTVQVTPEDGRSVTDRFDVAAGAALEKEYELGEPPPTEAAAAPTGSASAGAAEPPPIESAAAELLKHARELRAQGHYRAAADTYEKLHREHPTSAEARAALVSLGDISLSRLGDPAKALASFDMYLDSGGGVLEEEARIGRIRALRTLNRKTDERAAIQSFLESHPKSNHREALEKRLTALGR